jgi:hypothetical protein
LEIVDICRDAASNPGDERTNTIEPHAISESLGEIDDVFAIAIVSTPRDPGGEDTQV